MMEILSDPTDMLAMPRFDDGAIDEELLRRLAEQVVNAVMDAEATSGAAANSRNGYRERGLATCGTGTPTPRIPKLRTGSFFPDDVIERYQRVDRPLAAVAEMYATGTSTQPAARRREDGDLQALQGPGERHRVEPGTPTSMSSAQGPRRRAR